VNVIHGEIHARTLDLHTGEKKGYTLFAHSGFLHVPPWEAFGYAVVSPSATVQYLFDARQDVEAERFVNPLAAGIAWPSFRGLAAPILCQRDLDAPSLAQVLAELRTAG